MGLQTYWAEAHPRTRPSTPERAHGEEVGVAAIGERADEGGAEGRLGEGAEWLAVVITPHLGAVLVCPLQDVAMTVW